MLRKMRRKATVRGKEDSIGRHIGENRLKGFGLIPVT